MKKHKMGVKAKAKPVSAKTNVFKSNAKKPGPDAMPPKMGGGKQPGNLAMKGMSKLGKRLKGVMI